MMVGERVTNGLASAAFEARYWHGGQFSASYALSCGVWDHLEVARVHEALAELEIALGPLEDAELRDDLKGAVEELRLWCAANPIPEEDD